MSYWTYERADALLQGRCKESRKLENNTHLLRLDDRIAVRFHNTQIVTFYPNGDVVLQNWDSRTTRDRLNSYAPGRVFAHTDRALGRVICFQYHMQNYVFDNTLTIKTDGSVWNKNGNPAKVWDRDVELQKKKEARDSERKRVRGIRLAAEAEFKRAGLKREYLSVVRYDGPVNCVGWTLGKIVIHLDIYGGKPNWDRGFAISYGGLTTIITASTPSEAIERLHVAVRMEDKIGGYLSLKKMGIKNADLLNEITRGLSA